MLAALLPGEATPYPCSVSQEKNTLIWPLTSADTSVSGTGKCELSYYVGEQLIKSVIFQTYIAESLAAPGDAPDPRESWIEDILTSGADAIAAKTAIENMSVSSETLSCEKSAIVEKSERDGHVHLTFFLPKGENGTPGARGESGYTPIRGVDYFTPEDIAYFDGRIDERLGAIGGALDELHAYAQGLVIGGDAS